MYRRGYSQRICTKIVHEISQKKLDIHLIIPYNIKYMPKSMHLVPGMTSLNTKKAKVKITKSRMLELKEEHRLHNKKYKKDPHLAPLMVMDFDKYLKFRFGKLKHKKKDRGLYQGEPMPHNRVSEVRTETKVEPHVCAKKEPKVYDGERKLIGIGILHKSNLVPIFDEEHAKDLSKMRR